MTPAVLALVLLGSMLVATVACIVVGVLKVVRLGRALKARLDGYKELPVFAYVDRTQVRIARAQRRIETASALAYRAQAAVSDIATARARLQAVVTSPTSLLRLATTLVSGR